MLDAWIEKENNNNWFIASPFIAMFVGMFGTIGLVILLGNRGISSIPLGLGGLYFFWFVTYMVSKPLLNALKERPSEIASFFAHPFLACVIGISITIYLINQIENNIQYYIPFFLSLVYMLIFFVVSHIKLRELYDKSDTLLTNAKTYDGYIHKAKQFNWDIQKERTFGIYYDFKIEGIIEKIKFNLERTIENRQLNSTCIYLESKGGEEIVLTKWDLLNGKNIKSTTKQHIIDSMRPDLEWLFVKNPYLSQLNLGGNFHGAVLIDSKETIDNLDEIILKLITIKTKFEEF